MLLLMLQHELHLTAKAKKLFLQMENCFVQMGEVLTFSL